MGDYESGGGEGGKKGGILGLPTACVACCGCLTVGVIGAVVAAAVGVAYIKGMVEGVVSDQPMEIAKVEYTPAEALLVNLRFDQYQKAVERGESPTLVFTEKELNTFVADQAKKQREEDPDAVEGLEGFQLSLLEDDSINVKLSQCIGNRPDGKPQYVNLDFTGKAQVTNGVWDVRLDSLQLGATKVPGFLLAGVQQALMEENQDPEFEKMKGLITNFKVSGGKVELQLDPETVKEMADRAEGAEDTGAPDISASTKDMEIYSFVEKSRESYKEKEGSYDPAKHDEAIYSEAADKFGLSKEAARAAHERVSAKMQGVTE